MENELIAFFTATEQTFFALWQEASLLEGDSLQDQWQWIVDRIMHERSPRVLWLLISGLVLSGLLFLLSTGVVVYEAVAISFRKSKARSIQSRRLAQSAQPGTADQSSERLSETIDWARKVSPKNVIGKLKAGQIDAAEKALIEVRKSKPDDVGLIMYLLACRAIRHDINSYESLVNKVFPNGLNADEDVCRHAAQIGRLLSEDRFPKSQIPDPESAFQVDAKLIGDTLGPVAEFGSVQTLLDLIRVYFDMDDVDEIRHLIVEVLVCGTAQQRKSALEYAKLLKRKSTS